MISSYFISRNDNRLKEKTLIKNKILIHNVEILFLKKGLKNIYIFSLVFFNLKNSDFSK